MVWLVVALALMIPLIAVLLDSQLGRALAGRLERRADSPGEQTQLSTRVTALEAEVDRMSKELEAAREESEFVRRLLEGKREGGALPPGDAR
jgi:hypothetical protein